MKKVSLVIACYNEEGNISPLLAQIENIFVTQLKQYDYEIICVDNDSTDETRNIIREICKSNKKVKAIFNVHNFGSIRSSAYGLLQATGDCVIKMCADFQDPPELVVDFVQEWENGYKMVLAIKNASEESKFMSTIRNLYYKIINKITDINHIDNFVGYGLYDRKFIEVLRSLNDPMPYIRGIIAELGYKYKPIYYNQPKRRSGKSKFNCYRLYDYAMLGITSYSKVPLRIATFLGIIVAFVSFIIGIFYLVLKLTNWNSFTVGMAPVTIGVFFFGAVQLLFIGLLGEYILAINTRVLNRPLVVEEERINFEKDINTDEVEDK